MDVPRLDAWLLQCVVLLVRECNVTRAGTALGLSQPAASAVLAKLRVLFQDPLLVKSTGGMVPTPRAIELAGLAEKLLADMRSMVNRVADFDASKATGTVSIAAMDYVRAWILPPLLNGMNREAPGLDLSIHEVDRTRIHERFERAEIDLGIGPQVVSTGRLHYRELWRDVPLCLMRVGHPAPTEAITIEDLVGFPHVRVVPSRPSFYDEALDTALRDRGLKRRVQISERSYRMVPCLLEATDMVCVVPSTFAIDSCKRYALRTSNVPVQLPELSMGLYWHERTHKEPLFQWLRPRIASLAARLTTQVDRPAVAP